MLVNPLLGQTRALDLGAGPTPQSFQLECGGDWTDMCPDRLNIDGVTSNFCAITATDPDGDKITFDTVVPDFCTFTDNGDGTGALVCNPTVGDHGKYPIVIVAPDDGNPVRAAVITFTLTVNPRANAGGPYDVIQGRTTQRQVASR